MGEQLHNVVMQTAHTIGRALSIPRTNKKGSTMLTVSNLTSPRTNKPVANQFHIADTDNNTDVFQSYRSMIVTIDRANSVITFGRDWDYSVTTSKYRNKFMSVMGFYELDNKAAITDAIKCGNAIINGRDYIVTLDEDM